MRSISVKFVFLFIAISALGILKPAYASKQLGPHEHGKGKITIAVEDDKTAIIEFESPADSIYGFEHKASSTKDKHKQHEGLEKLKSNIDKIIRFEKKLGCSFHTKNIHVISETEEDHEDGHHEASDPHDEHGEKHDEGHKGEHSEVRAQFVVKCPKSFVGSKLHFKVGKIFPKLKNIDVQVLSKQKQSTKVIHNDKGSVVL